MKPENLNILITGAAGGIGSATAADLYRCGATLLLTDLNSGPLEALAAKLDPSGTRIVTIAADIGQAADRQRLAAAAADFGVDTLINIAGINPFGLFDEQSDREIERAIAINTIAPMLLCRALLPLLRSRDRAAIVNVGSVFGSIGYPGFAVYSASKYAVRGFTEALRRELADTSIDLLYVAPRATRTALSTDRITAMNAELKVATDAPAAVAAAIISALSRSRRETYLGRAERIFSRINAVFPGLVDRALLKQLPIIRRYASARPDAAGSDANQSVNIKMLGAQR